MSSRRTMFTLLVSFLLIALLGGNASAAMRPGDQIKGTIRNEKAVARGDSVVITFTLDAPKDETYVIRVRMRKKDDPSFGRLLINARGDIGEGPFGQKHCRIMWRFPGWLAEVEYGEEYWFEITCELAESGIPWWVYGGGGSLVVGGVIAAILLKKNTTVPPPPNSSLPGPPTLWPTTP